jgi:hypothetical protein
MLFSREFVIQSIQRLVPTRESLSLLSTYILMFPGKMDTVLEVAEIEFRKSSPYHRLNILYLFNEMMAYMENAPLLEQVKSSASHHYRKSVREVVETVEGRGHSPEMEKSFLKLLRKIVELKGVWCTKLFEEAELECPEDARAGKLLQRNMDYEYIIEKARNRDADAIISHVKAFI